MKERQIALLEIHVAVLLFGVAGLFGKWLDLQATTIVWGRASFGSLFLIGLMMVQGQSLRLERQGELWKFLLSGVVLAFHWVAFFRSIQLSTVGIGLLTVSSFPLFTSLLEPIVLRASWTWKPLILSALVLTGVYWVIPELEWDSAYAQGAIWGLLSGASFAGLALFNRKQVQAYSAQKLAAWQNGVAGLCLLPFLTWESRLPTAEEWGLLLLLGVVFTGLSHTLFIKGMKQVFASTASLIAGLEPVYGILLAWWWLGESPGWNLLIGGSLIVGAGIWASRG
ncbi:MAG: EamA family transporter [Bacteroidota bacterium]